MSVLALFGTAFIAFSLSAICGGGAGLLLIPVLGTFLPVSQVPAALTIGTATSSLSRMWMLSKSVRWAITFRFVPASLLGATIGAELLAYLDPMYIEFCMGLFLVSNLPYLFKRQSERVNNQAPQSPGWMVSIVGAMAGTISALTGAVGVLFNRFYLRFGLSPDEVIATRAANEILLHLTKLILYLWLDLFDLRVLGFGVAVALAAITSSSLMQDLLPKLSREIFSRIGFSAMVLIGVLMLNSSVLHIRESANPNLRLNRLSDDIEATLTWNKLVYSLEFNYGEGPEYERVVPFSSICAAQQDYLKTLDAPFQSMVIEKVFSFRGISYEANFFDPDEKLIKKVEFLC